MAVAADQMIVHQPTLAEPWGLGADRLSEQAWPAGYEARSM